MYIDQKYEFFCLFSIVIAPDKRGIDMIFLFFHKKYVVGTHQKRLGEALLMSTHNIFLCGEV